MDRISVFAGKKVFIASVLATLVMPTILCVANAEEILEPFMELLHELFPCFLLGAPSVVLLFLTVRAFDPRSLQSPVRTLKRIYAAGRAMPWRRNMGFALKGLAVLHAVAAVVISDMAANDPYWCERYFEFSWVAWIIIIYSWAVVPVGYMAGEVLTRRNWKGVPRRAATRDASLVTEWIE